MKHSITEDKQGRTFSFLPLILETLLGTYKEVNEFKKLGMKGIRGTPRDLIQLKMANEVILHTLHEIIGFYGRESILELECDQKTVDAGLLEKLCNFLV